MRGLNNQTPQLPNPAVSKAYPGRRPDTSLVALGRGHSPDPSGQPRPSPAPTCPSPAPTGSPGSPLPEAQTIESRPFPPRPRPGPPRPRPSPTGSPSLPLPEAQAIEPRPFPPRPTILRGAPPLPESAPWSGPALVGVACAVTSPHQGGQTPPTARRPSSRETAPSVLA